MLPSGLNANATRRWRAGIGKIALILPEATSHSRTSLRRGFQEPTARVDESGLNASGVELRKSNAARPLEPCEISPLHSFRVTCSPPVTPELESAPQPRGTAGNGNNRLKDD